LGEQACSGLNPVACQLTTIAQVEELAGCSCCASQICGCQPDVATNEEIFVLNEQQREMGITPQCDINGTLCGAPPQQP
jgi:hypothetical protein